MRTISIILLICFVNTFSQSDKTLLINVQNKFDSIKNFSTDFSQVIPGNSGSSGVSGNFTYVKENKFIIEMGRQNVFCDGTTIWNYDSELNRTVINTYTNNTNLISFENYIFKYPSMCNVEELDDENTEFMQLKLSAKNSELGFDTVNLLIDKEYLIRQVNIYISTGMTYFFQFDNYEINSNKQYSFEFSPPEGSEIIDLR